MTKTSEFFPIHQENSCKSYLRVNLIHLTDFHGFTMNEDKLQNYSIWRFLLRSRYAIFVKVWKWLKLLNPIRPGEAQRPGWPNSQLSIRNLLSYDAQTWRLFVFILVTPFGHISAKLVYQWGCCCSLLIETSQKFWKWKIFPMLENCWNWHGGSILGREERFWA